MAANPFNASVPGNSFIFDIYNDGQTLRAAAVPPSQILPGGPCNYTDSMLPRCGCRRFWSRAAVGSGFRDSITAGTAEICMCSHHACFHEDVQPTGPSQLPPVSSNATVVGQENKRPRSSREPLSPVQELPWQMPTSFGASLDFNLLDIQPPLPLENNKRPAQETQMPDTYNSWGDMIQSQPAHAPTEIPSIPAQCLLSSQQHLGPSQHPPSTASSSQARYLRPFAGKGLHTLSGVPAPRSAAPPPPPTGSVDGDTTQEHDPGSRRDREATPRASAMHGRSMAKNDSSNYEKLAETVESHAERLDRLETTSFSVAGHEECQDKHDHIDMRVTELESRVEEVEKILNDNGSVVSGRRLLRNDVAADDTASVSSNNTILASNRAEVYNQIQQLQAQVSQLQAASLPTYSKPWELEVVFMPFPLKGVWIEASQFCISRRNSNGADGEWTQMPNTISRATPDPQSPKFSEWRGQSADSQWLLPRAFAAGRIVDQRLRSRGLIKTVLVRGADARSVQLAIHDAFADVLRVSSLGGPRTDYSPNSPLSEFLGLRQSWVPLRKLHKDSRLRFLTPAEMATPALWDFTFLVSSVVMKATGVHRLYITQPEAYLQDHPMGYQAFETGWTWQKLRELSRVYPDSQSSTGGDVPEADALEECWTWNDKVDEHANATTSLISLRHPQVQNLSRRSSTEPSSQQFYTGVQSPILSNGLSFVRAQSPLTPRDRKGLVSVRMGSVPPPLPPQALASPALSRRRLHHSGSNSTPYERRSSPFVSSSSSSRPSPRPPNIITTNGGISNKRRFTRSPSVDPHHHHYQNRRMNTPRYSRASMSRSPSLAPPSFFDRAGSAHPPNIYYHTPASEGQWGGNGYHSRAGSRPPVNSLLRTNGYDPDDDEDDDEDMEDDDDSQSSNGKNHDNNNNNFSSSFGFGDAQQQRQGGDDEDVDVYYDEEEEEEEEENQGQRNGWSLRQQQQQQVSIMPAGTRPEDIPWAGIEDNMSDGENVDPSHHGGGGGGGGSSFTATSSSFGSSASSFQSRPASQGGQVENDRLGLLGSGGGAGQVDQVMEGTEDEEEEEEDENSSQAPSEYSSKPGPWRVIDHPPVGVVGHSEVVLVGREESHNKRRESLREMMMPPPLPTPGPGPPTSAVGNSGMMTMMGFQVYEDGTAGDDGVE